MRLLDALSPQPHPRSVPETASGPVRVSTGFTIGADLMGADYPSDVAVVHRNDKGECEQVAPNPIDSIHRHIVPINMSTASIFACLIASEDVLDGK